MMVSTSRRRAYVSIIAPVGRGLFVYLSTRAWRCYIPLSTVSCHLYLTHPSNPVWVILYRTCFSIIVEYGECMSLCSYTLQFVGCYTYDSWFCCYVLWWVGGCVCPYIRALTWLLLIYYATWISLSEFFIVLQDQATCFCTSISCIPGSTPTCLSICIYQCESRAAHVFIHFISLVFVYLFPIHIILQLPPVSVVHACVYTSIHLYCHVPMQNSIKAEYVTMPTSFVTPSPIRTLDDAF